MKIAFDVAPLLTNNKSGIGYCQYGFIKELIEQNKNNEYILNFFSKGNYYDGENELNGLFRSKCKIDCCKWFSGVIYKIICNYLPIPYKCFFSKKVDLTHFFNYYLPPGVRGKKVVTVHDMTYKRFPKTVRFKTKVMLNISLAKSLKRADVIIAVSKFSKNEILSYFPQYKNKIKVVYNGVDLNFFKPEEDEQKINKIKTKYKIENDYFLYLGTLEPRKNIERLIESYYLLAKELNEVPKLVLSGQKGWMYNDIFKKVKELKLEDNVIFTGYIEEKDVPALISGTIAFLFPSIYEGFGMPPLEAMACGTPVLTSNISSLSEVVGDAAVLVDPFSVESIKNGMKSLLMNENLRNKLSILGAKRAKQFSWSKVTKDLYGVYEELMR